MQATEFQEKSSGASRSAPRGRKDKDARRGSQKLTATVLPASYKPRPQHKTDLS
jgi:hypothetical protein